MGHGVADRTSNSDRGSLLLDFAELIQATMATARAHCARLGPRFRRADIGIPEWPGATLPRPNRVNTAFSCLIIEEHAIAVVVFDKAFADADLPHVTAFEGRQLQAHGGGQRDDFLF